MARFRLALTAALLCGLPLSARSQDSTEAPQPARQPDTVRVWVPSLNLHGTQGVVRRQTSDTVYFILYYPTRDRWLDTRVPGSKIERIMVRDGIYRSPNRAFKAAGAGVVTGAIAGAIVGVFSFKPSCQGGLACNSGRAATSGRWAAQGAGIGGVAGALVGGLIGYGKTSHWRQVYP
jgi:hypothetical protein